MSSPTTRTAASRTDAGFTLIELTVVTALMAILGTISMTAFVNYQRAADLEGTAEDVVSALRTTAQRSVTEGRTYCVSFDQSDRSYVVYRATCDAASPVAVPAKTARGPAELHTPSFAPADATSDVCTVGDGCAYFYPRGTGSPGSVVVHRPGGKSITVSIEGLTSRVVRS